MLPVNDPRFIYTLNTVFPYCSKVVKLPSSWWNLLPFKHAKGHSGSHYNNLSFLQLLVSCSVVKFNLRRVNRIFPPNASLLTIINLLLSTKRALLWNEIEDPLKTSGKHHELLCIQCLFSLQISLHVPVCRVGPSCAEAWPGSLPPVCFCLQWQDETYLTVADILYSFWFPVGLAFSLQEELFGL